MRRIIFPRAEIPPTMDRYPSSSRQEDPLLHGRNEFFHANGNDRMEPFETILATALDVGKSYSPSTGDRRGSVLPPIWISSIRFSTSAKSAPFSDRLWASVKILVIIYLF